MDRIGLTQNYQSHCFLHSTTSLHTQLSKVSNFTPNFKNPKVVTACMAAATPAVAPTATSFGFKNLMETVTIDVHKAEGRPLNVPLIAPFTIASSRLDKVENVAIRVELSNGCVGWGEAPILPFVTAEDQTTALAKAAEACEFLKQSRKMTLSLALTKIGDVLPGHDFASVRAGVEMALIDAAANSIGIPLWRLFGGVSNAISTGITIPIVSPMEASELASKYRKQGFKTLKLKVGKNLNGDIEVLQSIRAAHPDCLFILDANEGYTANEAIKVLEKLHEMDLTPVLFEQPVHRDDWEGLGHVSQIAKDKYGVSVAADESCRSLVDAKKIVQESLADVINIKLAKVGVLGALEIIDLVRSSGLNLMIGGMVETRLAMGFAGHLAAGLGCFKFIDLDTPLLLAEDPVFGGYEASGPDYSFSNARGHGGFLHWENIACNSLLSIEAKNEKKKHLQVTVMKTASKLAVLTVLVLLLAEAHISVAVTCSAIQLSPCLGAITSNSAPSTLCCSRIREQKPCLCTYLKNPTLRNYVNSPGAKKVARTCGVPYPKC